MNMAYRCRATLTWALTLTSLLVVPLASSFSFMTTTNRSLLLHSTIPAAPLPLHAPLNVPINDVSYPQLHSKLQAQLKLSDEEDSQINLDTTQDYDATPSSAASPTDQKEIQSLLKQKEERETMINRLKLQLNEFKLRVEESERKAREAGDQIVNFLEDQGLWEDIKSQFR